MKTELGTCPLSGAFALGAFVLLLSACQGSPGEASAQVPGVRNGELHGDTSVIVRRVWESDDPDFWASEPSPDGRYLTEIDWETGDLAVVDLLAGEQRRVTHKGDWFTSDDEAETSVFSPDGARIAYAWYSCAADPCRYQIRIIDADGSNERTLVDPDRDPFPKDQVESFYPMLYGWSGDNLLTMVWWGRESEVRGELGIVSATDGSFRSLVPFRQDVGKRITVSGQMALSPNARLTAYGIQAERGADEDIVIVSAEDGRETGRIAGPASDRVVGFTPDGTGLFFVSDRELTEGVWRQPLRDGRPNGDPVLLRSDLWRTRPIGVSRDALFFGVMTETTGVRVASFDPETGALLSEPVPVEPPSGSTTRSPVWSRDGRHLAYLRADEREGSSAIVIRSLSGDDAREVPLPQRLIYLALWPEDGAILAVGRAEDTGSPMVFRVHLETGTLELLFSESGVDPELRPVEAAMGPAGPQMYYMRENGAFWALVARDLGTGSERELLTNQRGNFRGIRPSPDGKTLALIIGGDGSDALFTIDAGGEALREVHRGMTSRASQIVWTPDSRYFFFPSLAGDPPVNTLWRGDAATGEVLRMSEQGKAYYGRGSALHPGGRRIAFWGGQPHGEVWMMTNLPGERN
jgi:hypothetical protein